MLYFASPFFQAALSGDWAETASGRPQSTSSVITISQLPSVPGERNVSERLTETTFTREIMEFEPDESDVDIIKDEASESDMSDVEKDKARQESLEKLQSTSSPTDTFDADKQRVLDPDPRPRTSKLSKRPKMKAPDAVIVLKEEKVRCSYDRGVYITDWWTG